MTAKEIKSKAEHWLTLAAEAEAEGIKECAAVRLALAEDYDRIANEVAEADRLHARAMSAFRPARYVAD